MWKTTTKTIILEQNLSKIGEWQLQSLLPSETLKKQAETPEQKKTDTA